MKPKRKRAWRRAAYKRKRNPSRATGARYNNTHIADAKKMLCLADKSCGEEFSGYRTVYSGKPPWNEYEKLEFYVFEKRTPYSSMWDWIVVDPSFRSKVVATGELYERTPLLPWWCHNIGERASIRTFWPLCEKFLACRFGAIAVARRAQRRFGESIVSRGWPSIPDLMIAGR